MLDLDMLFTPHGFPYIVLFHVVFFLFYVVPPLFLSPSVWIILFQKLSPILLILYFTLSMVLWLSKESLISDTVLLLAQFWICTD